MFASEEKFALDLEDCSNFKGKSQYMGYMESNIAKSIYYNYVIRYQNLFNYYIIICI